MASKAVVGVLVGCGVIIVIGIIAIVAGGWFVKTKIDQGVKTVKNIAGSEDSEYGQRSAKLAKEYPFTAPADGIVPESQLTRYLDVRKAMFVVYQQHDAEIKQIEAHKDKPQASDLMNGASIVNDLRLAQVAALEQQKMSLDEYRYMTNAVYVEWTAMVTKEAISKANPDQMKQQLQAQIDQINVQLQNANLPEEAKKSLQSTKETLEQQLNNNQLEQINQGLKQVPEQNIQLFKKYDQEIRKYMMGGLEMIGF